MNEHELEHWESRALAAEAEVESQRMQIASHLNRIAELESYNHGIAETQDRLQAAEETGAEATRMMVAAVSDQMSALNLVSRIREAIGDNGRRMQDELIGYCAQLYRSNKAIEEERDGFWRSRAEAAEAKMDNLAALVRVLVHSLRKVNPNSSNIIRAMDYLTRTGLTGSILRDDEVKP